MKFRYSIELLSGALTGVTGIIGKDIDIKTKTDEDNFPYFPASHIKGIMRFNAERFVDALDLKDGEEVTKRYFGDEGKSKSNLRISDAKFVKVENIKRENLKKEKNLLYSKRHGIRVNRKTKTVEDNSLFNYEYILEGGVFEGEIEFLNIGDKEELKIIILSFLHIDKIGGLKSRGLGKVKVKIDDHDISEIDKILKKVEIKEKKILILSDKKVKKDCVLEVLEKVVLKKREIGNEIVSDEIMNGSSIKEAIINYFIENYDISKEIIDKLVKEIKVSNVVPENYSTSFMSFFEGKYDTIIEKEEDKIGLVDALFDREEEKNGNKKERLELCFLNSKKEKFKVRKMNSVGVNIDRKTLSAKDGMLYNKEMVYYDNNKFSLSIEMPLEVEKKLNGSLIYIGKYKMKGFGKTKISFYDKKDKKNMNLKDRIELFTEKSKVIENKSKENKVITIDVISDIVFPFLTINVENLKKLLKLKEMDLELEKKYNFINYEKMAGYNIVNNIRKNDELIVKRGSVITCKGKISGDTIKILEEFEKNGIGVRKDEGFGVVEICSLKHLGVK